MGQIVSSAAKPKRCNLNQLSQVPTPAAGEYILVSSDNSMNAAGQGIFDCYIEGDGQKAATALELKRVDGKLEEEVSQLSLKVTGLSGGDIPIYGQENTGGYYNNYGKLTSYTGVPIPVYYSPIDVSAYKGKTLKLVINWQVSTTPSSWLNLCMFRPDSNISTNAGAISGRKSEAELFALATNGQYILEIPITDNYLLLAKRNETTTIVASINIDGKVPELEQEIVGKLDANLVSKHETINLFDESTGTVSGQYVSGCKAAINGDETYLTLSSAGSAMQTSYVSGVKFYFEDGTSQNAGTPTSKYSLYSNRRGLVYAVPSGAKIFEFTYRAQSSSGPLLYEVMVTRGDVVPDKYLPYYITYQFKNPNFDALLGSCFVAVNGNDDTGDGTESNPYATINRALRDGREIIIKEGFYEVGNINLENSQRNEIKIRSLNGERPILFGGTKLLEQDGELVSGYTKVHSAVISGPFTFSTHWIFQYGVTDESTLIPIAERTAYHGRRSHRCDYTALLKVSSIAEVESSEGYAYYYDSSNSTLYYSRPETVTNDKFLFGAVPSGYLFSAVKGKTLTLNGLTVYGRTFNVTDTINSTIENCHCFASVNGAGFQLDRSINLLLNGCEVARVENGASTQTGDGINVHLNKDATDKTKFCSFELRNCWSHDNWNDGYSDHEGCEGFINGGLYEHNCIGGAGAGLTPSYGAHDCIKDAIVQSNGFNGVFYVGDGTSASYETGTFGTITADNVLSRFNNNDGFACASGNDVTDFINCVAYGNRNYGFGGGGTFRCVNCKSVDNLAGQYSATVTNIGSE